MCSWEKARRPDSLPGRKAFFFLPPLPKLFRNIRSFSVKNDFVL